MTTSFDTEWQALNDPLLKSWVESANVVDCDFPIQNLPFGIFNDRRDPSPRAGVAIGEYVVDLRSLAKADLLPVVQEVFARSSLNEFISLGRPVWRAVRRALSSLLEIDNRRLRDDPALIDRVLVLRADATMHLPVAVAGYTDFYSSREHATSVGAMFRDPKNALLPNWLEMPIGYNGRASSVVVSGTDLRRPLGQVKPPGAERPAFAPCRKLDIELETGFIVGKGSRLGEPIRCCDAQDHIFGMVLLNDWSARDLQQWEYVPLGPFNSKTFATTISPWVVTLDALDPFRSTPPVQSPQPLEYLRYGSDSGFDIHLEVEMKGRGDELPTVISRTNFKHMYWTMAQQLAHHTVSGCNTQVGDLMGSGTISGPTPDSAGSLLELTWNGKNPVRLSSGATRSFVEDGDELKLRGWCQAPGYRVGFGECVGRLLPALDATGYWS